MAAGVGAIIIDSEVEIERVADAAARAGRVQRVRLRVNSGVHASTHEFLATAHEDQKFGVSLDRAVELGTRIRSHASLDLLGLHCHIGSQIFDSAGFAESAERLLAAHAELAAVSPLPELNLGGGFGIAYTSADDPTPIEEIALGIAEAVASGCRAHGVPVPKLAFEPGRSIIGPAGITLYTVGTVKPVPIEGGWRHYASVDGGMSDNARTALYGADYSARIASRVSDAPPALFRVAGRHCEIGDIVVDAEYLPHDVAPGDLLAVAATGAYCWSLASNYNHVPRPAVVAVRDGVAPRHRARRDRGRPARPATPGSTQPTPEKGLTHDRVPHHSSRPPGRRLGRGRRWRASCSSTPTSSRSASAPHRARRHRGARPRRAARPPTCRPTCSPPTRSRSSSAPTS